MILVAEGDRDALAALYERYMKRLYNYVYYRTHQRETAEDIVSDVFIHALEKVHTFDPKRGNVSAWLYRITRNLTIDHFRKMRPMQNIEDVWDLADDTDIVRDTDTALKMREARNILQKLSPEQREIVLLRLWDNYSFREIAEFTGKSEGAVKMAFGRALKSIRTDLALILLLPFLLHS